MALPASGPISFNAINVELGVAGTTTASLGQASYRSLAGVASGAISLSNFYGKSNAFTFSITSNQTNANLRTLALAAGWNGTSAVTATVNSGVYVYSTSTGTPGLTINGSFPGGVSLVNNGYIIGMGGKGGTGNASPDVTAGGNAISLGVSVSITNNSYIAGGGGGGAAGEFPGGGGGAGGGNGGGGYDPDRFPGFGTGGGPGSAGGNGIGYDVGDSYNNVVWSTGAGGGRVLPGSGGAGGNPDDFTVALGGGAGGGGGFQRIYEFYDIYYYSTGGAGGSAGSAALGYNVGGATGSGGGGGGGWGASGGSAIGGGGAAGGAGRGCARGRARGCLRRSHWRR